MYLRAVRAVDYATTLPLWDGKRIMSNGSSQGGAQAIAIAAIDKRVGAVCAYVPAITDLAGYLQDHRCSWPGYGYKMKKGENLDSNTNILPYYDGAVMIQHTDAKLWIEAGLIDTTCPPECVIAAFNIAPSTDKTLYTFPYRPHSGYHIDKRIRGTWVETIDTPRNAELLKWLK
jgi:cephalosporin-C deacetylase-like acetyl esterase